MAVRIPIITDFDGKGIARARREFAQLESASAKATYAIRKAALPAAAAMTALTAVTVDAVKAAFEDQAAQEQLARTIRTSTGATDTQIAANEDWIATQGKLTGFTDDDLRPALAKLVRVTKDVTRAQELAVVAQDVARGTGKDLGSVTDALTKSLGGNNKALRNLAPELATLIKDGASADEVIGQLARTFAGDASAYAETAAGKFDVFALRVGELKEAFGNKLIPFLTDRVIPTLERLVDWAEKNPDTFKDLALGVGVFTGAVLALNFAMAVSPWALWIAGATALILYLERTYGLVTTIAAAFDKLRSMLPGSLGGTVSAVVEQQLTATRMIQTGEGAPFGGGAFRGATQGNVVTINVNGGDPRAVVDAIVRWSRQNGKLPPQIRTAQ